jgi:DNA-binding transcriptional LysR family regulator
MADQTVELRWSTLCSKKRLGNDLSSDEGNMTLKQLEACYWAVQLGSFAIAADRLNITQSTLSKRIFELEEELGCPLFDRSSRRAQPTEMALQILETIRDISKVGGSEGKLHGTCRFGVSEMVALTWLPDLLLRVRADHPDLLLRPYVDLAGVLERKVLRGELDFAVAPGPGREHSLQRDLVKEVSFDWMVAHDQFPSEGILTSQYLESATIITMTDDSGLTQSFDGWCQVQGIRVRKTIACNNLTTIIGLTIAGLGLSFLPTAFTESCVRNGLLRQVDSTPRFPSLNYHFISREDDKRTMVQILRRYVNDVANFANPILQWGRDR